MKGTEAWEQCGKPIGKRPGSRHSYTFLKPGYLLEVGRQDPRRGPSSEIVMTTITSRPGFSGFE